MQLHLQCWSNLQSVWYKFIFLAAAGAVASSPWKVANRSSFPPSWRGIVTVLTVTPWHLPSYSNVFIELSNWGNNWLNNSAYINL